MAITTFDTHKYVRRLEQAGMPLEQAEVQAEVLTEAFMVNLESLVTKEYLESRLDVRFAEQKAYMDTKFAKLDATLGYHNWILGIITIAVLIPLIERLAAL